MKGVEFKDQTQVLGKPEGMTGDECQSLPVKFTSNGDYKSIESVWELSDEELDIIIKSKRIRIGIFSNGMPPIYLQVES